MGVLASPAWIVWRMNGVPLPPEHGFPARLLVPGRYGWQNIKHVVLIELVNADPMPEWQRTWPTDYPAQALVVYPSSVALVSEGETVRFLGKAFGGRDPVVWVGLSFDDGATTQDAELTYAPGADRWTLWRYDWTPPAKGAYTVQCYARTAGGAKVKPKPKDVTAYAGGMVVEVEVG